MKSPFFPIIVLFCLIHFTTRADAQSDIGNALSVAFHPMFAQPREREMGQFQMSISALNRIRGGAERLQVAFVLDGTKSMAAELVDIRAILPTLFGDLNRYYSDVGFALVVYRDIGAKQQALEIPNKDFVHWNQLREDWDKLETKSGRPFFPELVDRGVQAAATQLHWSDSPNVRKMMFLIGDAPPYEEGFQHEQVSLRTYSTNELVQLLVDMQVQTFCWMCEGSEKEAFTQTRNDLQKFMQALSISTGGQFFDLTDPKIKAQSRYARIVGRAPVVQIPYPDLSSVTLPADAAQKTKLSVIPVEEKEGSMLELFPDSFPQQLEFKTTVLLRSMPNMEVLAGDEIEDIRIRLRNPLPTDPDELAAVADANGLDGILFLAGKNRIYVYATRRNTLRGFDANETSIVPTLQKILPSKINKTTSELLSYREFYGRPEILAAFALLEKASRFPIGDARADEDLNRIEELLSTSADSDYVLRHYLLAQLYFLRSLDHTSEHELDPKALADKARRHLRSAYFSPSRDKLPQVMNDEIEADYSLIILRDYDDAINRYQNLLSNGVFGDQTRRRLLWTLAGIRAGDWGGSPRSAKLE